jgi:hypothetical protein
VQVPTGATTGNLAVTIPGASSSAVYFVVGLGPSFTSSGATTFAVGSAGSFTVTATGVPSPTLTSAGNLPAGVTFNATTGLLSGTPTAGTGGDYPIVFTAQNATSIALQSFTLTITQPPAITSVNSVAFASGKLGSFTTVTTGFPVPTVSESGALPSGIAFNAASGTLGGTPAAGTTGSYPITFTASNGIGSNATQNFTLSVISGPSIATLSSSSGSVGASITISGSNFGGTQGTSTVTFNGVAGAPCGTCWSTYSIVVLVPPGATTGNIVVTVAGVVSNSVNFTVVPGAFLLTGNLNYIRQGHASTQLNDGTVLITGGYNGGTLATVSAAEIYSPSTGNFTVRRI